MENDSKPSPVQALAAEFRKMGTASTAERLQILTSRSLADKALAAGIDPGTFSSLAADLARQLQFERVGLSALDVEHLRAAGLTYDEIRANAPVLRAILS